MALDDSDNKKNVTTVTSQPSTPLPSPSSLTEQEQKAIADYRTGAFSLQAIANRNGFKHKNTIARLVKRAGVTADLASKVAAKRDTLIDKAQPALVKRDPSHAHEPRVEPEIEAAAIEAVARLQADITIIHRGDIKSARRLVVKLVEQLGAAMDSEIAMKQVRELLKEGGIEGKSVDDKLAIMGAAMSMRGRSEILRNISMAMKNLVPLERTAFGLDNTDGSKADHVPIEERVKRWTASEKPLPANVTPINAAKSA